jgi:hypothetical protein
MIRVLSAPTTNTKRLKLISLWQQKSPLRELQKEQPPALRALPPPDPQETQAGQRPPDHPIAEHQKRQALAKPEEKQTPLRNLRTEENKHHVLLHPIVEEKDLV